MKALHLVSALVIGITAANSHASDVTIPNTFTSGTPAVAAQVNANFTAIETAVDDNDARLDAIELTAPLTVNCNGNPGALQAAVNTKSMGLLTINFDGYCDPVTISRSDITLIGAGVGTSSIGGAFGNNFSLHLKGANNITLQNTRLNRIDTTGPILMVSQSSMVLDGVEIDYSNEGTLIINGSSLTMRDCQINSSIGAYLGSSLVIEENNNFNTPNSTALSASNSSSIFFFGSNNMIMAGWNEDALSAAENSSIGMMVGNYIYIDGNISASGSSHISLMPYIDIQGDININSSSVSIGNYWEPMTIWGNISVMNESSLDIRPSVYINGNMQIQSSTVTMGDWTGPMMNIMGDIDVRMGSNLQMSGADVQGALHASNHASIEASYSQITNGLIMDGPFVNFQGNDVNISTGGTFREFTKISLNGNSSLQGDFDVVGGFGWLDTPVDTFSANFTSCGAISMQSVIGFPGHVCQDADSDGTMNYLDYCPTTSGTGAPAGCP